MKQEDTQREHANENERKVKEEVTRKEHGKGSEMGKLPCQVSHLRFPISFPISQQVSHLGVAISHLRFLICHLRFPNSGFPSQVSHLRVPHLRFPISGFPCAIEYMSP